MTVEPQDRIPGQHMPSCGCRTEADGKRVADWNCLTTDERAVIQALLAGSGEPPISARR